ncbi:MAG: hypothetical protein QM773_02875 [Hyphomonadaceae bacterium]
MIETTGTPFEEFLLEQFEKSNGDSVGLSRGYLTIAVQGTASGRLQALVLRVRQLEIDTMPREDLAQYARGYIKQQGGVPPLVGLP